MGKIERLPSAKLTTETLLHMALEDATNMEGLVLICKDQHGHMWSAWTQMSVADLAMAALHLQKEAMDVIE